METLDSELNSFMSTEEIQTGVLSNYNLEVFDIENVKFKDTKKQRAVFKVTTNRGIKCLKKVYYDEATLLFIYSVIEWLNAKEILCPRLLSTRKGYKYVNYKDNLFILTDWVEGRKCDYDDINDVIRSAKYLAKIHKYSYGFNTIEGSILRKADNNYVEGLNKHFLQLLDFSNKAFIIKDKFSRVFLDNFDYNLEKAQESVYLLSFIDFTRNIGDNVSNCSICHLDYVNKNIIFTPDEKMYIIDFDRTEMDMPVHDIIYYLRRLLKRENTSWDFDVFKAAMESYEEIRPLSYSEYIVILSNLMFPHKYWKVSRDYYRNRKECNKDAFTTILKKISKQQTDHDVFCNKLKEYIDYKFKE